MYIANLEPQLEAKENIERAKREEEILIVKYLSHKISLPQLNHFYTYREAGAKKVYTGHLNCWSDDLYQQI